MLYHLNDIHQELKIALSENQLELHFQPQFDIIAQKVIGVEALLRWKHPTKGYIPPLAFIPFAEQTGLILEIEKWVLKKVIEESEIWRTQLNSPFSIAVNISPTHFQHSELLHSLEGIFRSTNVSPHILELEITERLPIHQLDTITQEMKVIKQQLPGIRFAIDDFGTGYNSLFYLRKFPIDRIKLDGVFIQNVTNHLYDAKLVESIIHLAKNLNLDLIAEGVETKEQADLLKQYNSPLVQGYYFSKPLPRDQLLSFLSRNWLNTFTIVENEVHA